MNINEIMTLIGEIAKWLVTVTGACGLLWKWIAKPLRGMRTSLELVQHSTDMLMGDRLAQAHDYWVRKGYCPAQDRRRLIDMHKEYSARGLNHLADQYEDDLLELPYEPK